MKQTVKLRTAEGLETRVVLENWAPGWTTLCVAGPLQTAAGSAWIPEI